MDMNVDIVFRIAAIGMIVAILNQVLTRAGREGLSELSYQNQRKVKPVTLCSVSLTSIRSIRLSQNTFFASRSIRL